MTTKTNPLGNYFNKSPQRVTPKSITFPLLCTSIYAVIRQSAPGFIPTPSLEKRIHDCFVMCPPDLSQEGARWLLPGLFQKLAKEISSEVGAKIIHA